MRRTTVTKRTIPTKNRASLREEPGRNIACYSVKVHESQ